MCGCCYGCVFVGWCLRAMVEVTGQGDVDVDVDMDVDGKVVHGALEYNLEICFV